MSLIVPARAWGAQGVRRRFKDPLALNCKEAEDALVRLGLLWFAFARRLDIGHVVL